MLPRLTFVLGGAASGKSAWAENLLLNSALDPVYVATARAFDDEIKLRIKDHKSRRCDRWLNIEAEKDLTAALSSRSPTQAVLIDCATMWLTNLMMDEVEIAPAQSALLRALAQSPAPVVVVSNEVGHGIVPDNALARQFCDAQGRLNIALAAQSDLAVLVVAGLPHPLKGQVP